MDKLTKKPNVVFVFSDQHRYCSTGFARNKDKGVLTPNLDRLASRSINFTTAVSGCPVCSPYRATLLTGRYPQNHGIFVNDVCLSDEATSIAEAYHEDGYDTAYIGKWHLDGHGRGSYIPKERRQGFDYWKVLECTHDYNQSLYYEHDDEEAKCWDGYDAKAQTDDAIRYIKGHSGEKPFMMMLSFGPPHNPYDSAPQVYKAMYEKADLELRPNIVTKQLDKDDLGNVTKDNNEDVVREQLAGYYAHISALDALVGELESTIRELGIEEDTIFVYTSDHGDMLYSQNERRKQRPWDESILVPFLLRYPRLFGDEEKIITMPFEAPDIMPTLLSLCGIEVPSTVDGENVAPYITGEEEVNGKTALLQCMHPFGEFERRNGGKEYRGIRTERYTYVKDLQGPWLLYDNERDPYQLRNLIECGGYSVTINDLDGLLKDKLMTVKDEFLEGETYIKQWQYEVDENGTVRY